MTAEETVARVFADHGISMDDLDVTREDDPEGLHWCPVCERGLDGASGISSHAHKKHDARTIELVCGRETWHSILEELYLRRGVSADAIAEAIPTHTVNRTIRNTLREQGWYRPTTRGTNGLAGRLERMTAEEFDAIARAGR